MIAQAYGASWLRDDFRRRLRVWEIHPIPAPRLRRYEKDGERGSAANLIFMQPIRIPGEPDAAKHALWIAILWALQALLLVLDIVTGPDLSLIGFFLLPALVAATFASPGQVALLAASSAASGIFMGWYFRIILTASFLTRFGAILMVGVLAIILARNRLRQVVGLENEQQRLRATLDSLLDPHILLRAIRDARNKITDFLVADANDAACRYNRLPREGFVGHRLLEILPAHVATGLLALYCRAIESGEPLVLDDYLYPHDILAESRYYDIRGVKVGDALSFTWRDVTERHHAAKDLEHRARTDELTKLLNRRGIFEKLEDLRGKTPRTGSDIAVLFIDFDKFKDINDTCGHAAGDEVLRVTAEKLRACLRHSDDLGARVGGDEMLVVLHGVHGMKDAAAIAEKLRRSAAAPVRFDGTSIEATVSVGVALARAEESTDALVSRADAAMYEAKQRGRNQVITINGQA